MERGATVLPQVFINEPARRFGCSSFLLFPPPSPGGFYIDFSKRRKERKEEKKNPSRKETSCNDYSRHRPRIKPSARAQSREPWQNARRIPRSRFHPVENIARDRYIVCRNIFAPCGSRPIISLFDANFFFSFLFFSFNSEIVPSPSRRKRKFSFARWRLLLLLFGYIIGSNRCREREKSANFWNEKWSREKKKNNDKLKFVRKRINLQTWQFPTSSDPRF